MMTRRRELDGRGTRSAALVVAVAAAVTAVDAVDVAAQCAMCRTVLNSPEGQQLAGALRHGILVLLAAPFAVFATIAVLAIRGQRRRAAAEGGSHE